MQQNVAKPEGLPFTPAKNGDANMNPLCLLSSSLAGEPVGEVPTTVVPTATPVGGHDLRRNHTDNFEEVKQLPPESTPKLNEQDCDEASDKLLQMKHALSAKPFALQHSVEPRGNMGIIGAVENVGSSLGGFVSPRDQKGRASQVRPHGGGMLFQSLQMQRVASVQSSLLANALQNRRFTAKVSQVVPPDTDSDEHEQSSHDWNSKVLVSSPLGEKKAVKKKAQQALSPTKNGPLSPNLKPAEQLDNTPAQGEEEERPLMNVSALKEVPLGEPLPHDLNKSKSIRVACPEEAKAAPPFRKPLLKEEVAKAKAVMAQQDPVANAGVAEDSGEEEEEESGEGKFPQDVLFTNANDSKINNQMGSKQAGAPARRTNVIDTKHDDYQQIKRELEDSNVYFLNNLRREIDREARDMVIDPIEGRAADDASYFHGISELLIHVQPSEDAKYDRELLDLSTPTSYQLGAGAAVNRRTDKPRELPRQVAASAETRRNTLVPAKVRHEHVTQDESFMLSRIDDASRHKSMLLNSQDFDESKLLFTERRVLQLAEMDREYFKLLSGQWLQTAINQAKPNDVITLEKKTYKFQSLFIGSQITILGQPETVLEVDGGSIVIDFQKEACEDGPEGGNAADEELIVTQTPAHRSSVKSFGRVTVAAMSSPVKSTYDRGTPLNIKKSKVAKIQVCEIRFNRTKASQLQAGKRKDARGKHSAQNFVNTEAQQFSRNISLEKTGGQIAMGANGGSIPAGQPSQTLLQINTSANNAGLSQNNTLLNQASAEGHHSGPLACFLIEQDSFVEVKDCFIKSHKDQNIFYQELDNFIKCGGSTALNPGQTGHQSQTQFEGTQTGDNLAYQAHSEKNPDFLEWMQRVDTEIRDYCFAMNLGEDERQAGPLDYSGLVSLSSTTVQNFKVGVYCGPDSVLTAESSSFIAMRAGGVAIKSHLPKLIKVMNGSIQKCEAHGIQITLDEPPVPDLTRFNAADGSPARRDTERKRTTMTSQREEVLGTEPIETEQDEGAGQRMVRKIYIDNNRIVQVQGCPISIEGPERPHYLNYLIKVKDNRISNCGLESKLYAIPGATEPEKEQEKVQMAKAYGLIGGQPQSCILLQNLSVFNLVCFRNTISKGSGSGIKFYNCKGHKEDMSAVTKLPISEAEATLAFDRTVGDQQRVTVIDNYITDTVEGYGMIIDSTTCFMELNQLKKNAYGGLLITTSHLERLHTLQRVQSAQMRGTIAGTGPPAVGFSLDQYETARSEKLAGSLSQSRLIGQASARDFSQSRPQPCSSAAHKLSQIRAFNMVTCDNSTAMGNQKFGVAVMLFYGSVTFKNTQANENDGHGFVLQRQPGALLTQEQENGEHDDAYLDFELTDRSRTLRQGFKSGYLRSRSPTSYAPTDNFMFEPNQTSFRAEDTQTADKQGEAWPFEAHASQLHLFKCVVLQNRQDGIRNVDYRLFSLGTVIQGNSECAVRTMQPERGAELNIFIKSRANDNDLIGQVLGPHSRMTPNIKIDANMQVLLKNMKALQLQQIYSELVKITQGQEPETVSAAKAKSSEQQLVSVVEKKQISIDTERMVMPVGRRSPTGAQSGCFFKLFNCCSTKASDGRPLRSPPLPETKSQPIP